MRLLHCSDFHGNQRWFDWLVERAADFDLVCLTGDHLDLLEFERIGSQLRIVEAALGRVSTPLALCSGNHDSFSGSPAPVCLHHASWMEKLRRPGVWVDGDMFTHGGLRIRCIRWNAPMPSAAPGDIWLFHAPPARSPVAIDPWGGDAGDEILGEICRAGKGPTIVLSGHQHDPQAWVCCIGGTTWCLNPGYAPHVSVPNHIIVDTAARTAERVRTGCSADLIHLGGLL